MSLAVFPPIVGREELRYQSELLQLGAVPEAAQLSFEVVEGHVRLSAYGPEGSAYAWEIASPYEVWPPAVSASEAAAPLESFAGPIEVATWPDGCSLALGPGGHARWIPHAEANAAEGLRGASFVCSLRDDFDLVIERMAEGERLPVGAVALSNRYARALVTNDGALWLAATERLDRSVAEVFYADSTVRCLGSMPCPAWRDTLPLVGLIEREGGAWLLFRHRYSIVARAVDWSGFGVEWSTGWALMGTDEVQFGRCGNGLIASVVQSLAMWDAETERRLLVLATDGEHTTRALGCPPGESPVARGTALAVGPNGESILVAYVTTSGLVVARADFGTAAEPADPWDAKAVARAEQAYAERLEAAEPEAEEQEEEEDLSEPLFESDARPSCREVIEGLRATALATALFVMAHPNLDEDAYRGDNERGSYMISNGQGDLMVFAWNEHGIVATAFEHELTDEEADLPIEERRPLRFLGKIPRKLLPLAKKALTLSGHSVTGGLWMTEEEGRRGGELMDLLMYVSPSSATTEESNDAAEPAGPEGQLTWDVLLERLSNTTTKTTLTEDEVTAVLTAGEVEARRYTDSAALSVEGVKLGAKKLARLQVVWPDPARALARFRKAKA
jgi:hypothetical protein